MSVTSEARNWAGNYTYRAREVHRPASLEELQEIVAEAPRIRVLGSRHSFNDVADSAELIALDALPVEVEVDHAAGTVELNGNLPYGVLTETLDAEGVAVHNLASLPHISVAGATATATHGSGDRNGNLATAVAALELVTSEGNVVRARRGDPDFAGMVVGLGALGVVTRVTLDVEPAYEIRQRVFEGMAWDALLAHHAEIAASGYSVSVFTRWLDDVDQVWVKSRVGADPEELRPELFGARPATVDRHPILGIDPVNCSRQLGVPGPWSERLPHFRMGFTPSNGNEIQSEYLVPRRHAIPAIEAVRALAERLRPVLQVSELRTVAADELWMSPQHGEGTLGLHFTWEPEQEAVEGVLHHLEAALAPFEARPHWGKVFVARAAAIRPLYPRLPDFLALAERLDPRGAFRNDWFESRVAGA